MKLSLKNMAGKAKAKSSSKGGSVLIMVVGLLVLLALIGTAFLSSSHSERAVSIQATTDARVDLLVQGVEQMAKATIAHGLINPNADPNTPLYPAIPAAALASAPNVFQLHPKFDEPDVPAVAGAFLYTPEGFGNWDMPDLRSPFTNMVDNVSSAASQRYLPPEDAWLSPRFPQPILPVPPATYTPYSSPPAATPTSNVDNVTGSDSDFVTGSPLPCWLSIGRPLFGDHFESPFVLDKNGAFVTGAGAGEGYYTKRLDDSLAYTAGQNQVIALAIASAPIAPTGPPDEFIPQFVQVPPGSGNWFPAWRLGNGTAPNNSPTAEFYLAGDADGDGIADCGMFRLPSNLDGLTWYAGVRIVDNNSAVNVNTAWDRDHDFDGNSDTYLLPTSATPPYFGSFAAGASSGYTVSTTVSISATSYEDGQVPYLTSQGMFTANVGLQELLHTWNPPSASPTGGLTTANLQAPQNQFGEMIYLNEFRFNCEPLRYDTAIVPPFNGGLNTQPMGANPPQQPTGVFFCTAAGALNTLHPFDEYFDAPTQGTPGNSGSSTQSRTDFWYLTMGDALQNILGRRLSNPGNLNLDNPATNILALQAQRYGLEDASALAYHFCLINPATISPNLAANAYGGTMIFSGAYGVPSASFYSGAPPVAATSYGFGVSGSKIEHDLYRSVFDTAPNSPFPPPFSYLPPTGFTNLRNSGQSQYSPTLFNDGGAGNSTLQATETVASWYRDNFKFEDEGPTYHPVSGVGNLGKTNATFPTNFKPRRSMLVASNPVSNLMPWVDPPDYNTANSHIPTGTIVVSGTPIILSPGAAMGYANTNAPNYTISATPNLVPKANPNTSSFGDLWRAYWGVMATEHATAATNASFVGGNLYTQSPYGGTYTINSASQSVYLGRQFTPYTAASTPNPPATEEGPGYAPQTVSMFLPPSVASGGEQSQTLQGTGGAITQGMFCSPLRPTQLSAADQLNPDQVLLLRSALAAQNTIIMRDPLHGCLPYKPPGATTADDPAYYFNGNLRQIVHLGTTAQGHAYDALIYGAMQNPYITEVYVNNDNVTATPGPTANPDGYVAIKLFNPYSFNIPINGWALAVVSRPSVPAGTLVTPTVNIFYVFGDQLRPPPYPPPSVYGYTADPTQPANPIVPANNSPASRYQGGYLVLENYSGISFGGNHGAVFRPPSVSAAMSSISTTFTPPPTYTATATVAPPVLDIYVPNLATALFYQGPSPAGPPCSTQELVLLRPVSYSSATGAVTTEYVPVDSFDFTGLPNPPSATANYSADPQARATGWHYVRPTGPYGYPANTAATDGPPAAIPTSVNFGTPSSAFLTGNLWRFLYPGRYDASLNPFPGSPNPYTAAPLDPAPDGGVPRQQGVYTESWIPGPTGTSKTEPWVPPNPIPTPGFTFASPSTTYTGSYPIAFPFRYLDDSQPGPNPVRAVVGGAIPNIAPFGAFARDADIAQVPFVGAYVIVPQGTVTGTTPLVFAQFGSSTGLTQMADYNTLSSDLSMAEDTDVADDPIPDYMQTQTSNEQTSAEWNLWHEEIGRFCPIMNTGNGVELINKTLYSLATIEPVNDGDPLGGYLNSASTAHTYWRYHWATRLFDFLSVQTPHNDFLPNVDQTAYGNPNIDVSGTVAAAAATVLKPTPVSNSGLPALAYQGAQALASSVYLPTNTPTNNPEASLGVEGKININTANWRVLSTLPWVPPGMPRDQFMMGAGVLTPGADGIDDNVQLAQIICDYRDGTNYTGVNTGPLQLGPFRSIYDLYKIQPLYQYYNWLLATHEPSPNYGDQLGPTLNYYNAYSLTDNTTLVGTGTFTGVPVNNGFDGVRLDFEERANMLGRLSNLITTRSDSFTVYIVVQGWKNAGSTNPLEPPQLVVQRRSAFIADRSGITAPGGQVKTYNFPND